VWGLDAALTWWQTRRPLHLVVATVAACIAVGSRPSSGVAPLLALGIFAAVLGWRRQWRAAAWSGGASVVTFASYSAVNVARFGQLWGAPFELQVASAQAPVQRAAIAATGGTLVSPQYMLSTVARYLDPWPGLMRPTRLFPFVGWGPTAKPVLSSSHMYIEPAGSLPLSAPVVLVLAIVGAFWFVRRRPTTEWWAVAAAALMSSMVTLSFWSISQRYLVDLLTITFVLAAPGMWVALDWWRSRPPLQRRSLSAAVLVVTALAMWAQAGLALWTRHFSYLPRPDEVAAFVHFQYSVDDSLFSGSAPGVHQVSLRGTPSTSDHVVIAGWCGGTYVRSGFGWTAMERQPGGGRRLVLVPPAATRAAMAAGAVVVASGDGWRLETRPTIYPHFVKFFYIAGPVVHASMGGVNVDSNLVLDIVADPLTTDVDVRRGTDAVLLLHGVAAADRLVAGAGWNQLKGGSPFCESLLRRGVSAR